MLVSHCVFSTKPLPHLCCTLSDRRATPRLNFKPSIRASLSHTLYRDTLEALEWNSICRQLSAFTLTSMGFTVAKNGGVMIGRNQAESQKLLDQTKATALFSKPLDFSGIEDLSNLLNSAVLGEVLTVREACSVRRTLRAARSVQEQLEEAVGMNNDSSDRYYPLLEVLQNCNFQEELEQKIGFCIDCNLHVILDNASEELKIIRSERKRNIENLDALLKKVSSQILEAGYIDKPLITKRRSRMCVGIRTFQRYLLPDCIILNTSSSGATYFVEPKEAVEMNNNEVKLLNSERMEEKAILSLLTSEIAESESNIRYLLDRILQLDLAFARAAYARWFDGVCPIFSKRSCESLNSNGSEENSLFVDIEGLQHPLLLEPGLKNALPCSLTSVSEHVVEADGSVSDVRLSRDSRNFPVPIDIKVRHGTKVVVISGPNAGGKTASMKTLGLASCMSKAGMYLPAKKTPKIPWFDLVLADIGDHQSLERNLSTFSAHILWINRMLELASKESLVLIDEIASGTDPSEGLAISASILRFLKNHVSLAMVTTHYGDLCCLKENDAHFENAAMEFSLETLQPTYQILWGSTGDSNALSIARSIGFDENIIEGAEKWVDSLAQEKQERKGMLFQSLMEERNKLEIQAKTTASFHSEVMDIYHEIKDEADDLCTRERALKDEETQKFLLELRVSKSQLEILVKEFEKQLKIAGAERLNSLIRKSESAIASIVESNQPGDADGVGETVKSSYSPQSGDQVHVKGLGAQLATVIEAPAGKETVLVQYGNLRARVSKCNIKSISGNNQSAAASPGPSSKVQVWISSHDWFV